MKIVHINTTASRDTTVGSLVQSLAEESRLHGNKVLIFSGYGTSKDRAFLLCKPWQKPLFALRHRLGNTDGLCNTGGTRKLIKQLEVFGPDVVHLHNLHGYYLNIPLLSDWLLRQNIPVVITLHDCRLFTGRCASICNNPTCDNCPNPAHYPAVWRNCKPFDIAGEVGRLNAVLVAPSEDMFALCKSQKPAHLPSTIIHHGVDTKIFHPDISSDDRTSVRLLAVARKWTENKNPDILYSLAKSMSEDWQLTVVGEGFRTLQPNVKIIAKTSRERMAEIYRQSDLLLSPSLSEGYGLTISEAAACGIPSLVNKDALPRPFLLPAWGEAADFKDVDNLISTIKKALRKNYSFDGVQNLNDMAQEYSKLYEAICSANNKSPFPYFC